MYFENFKTRLLIYIYGPYILEAMALDLILVKLKTDGMVKFNVEKTPSKIDINLYQNLDFLVNESYINSYDDNYYDITQKGRLHLANGGFTLEAKKNKNTLYAFRISIISITIAIISIIVSFISWLRNTI